MNKSIKKALSVFGVSTSIFIQSLLFLTCCILIFLASYVVGFRYLQGNTLWGNDSFSYFSVVSWFDKYYPSIPFWFPLQGGGVSLIAGYPWLAAFAVINIARHSSYDLVQAFRLLGFLSVPLSAVGIFVLVWSRLTSIKNIFERQVVGIIASLIYTVSPIAWIWLVRWGFYSENVSHIFIPWIILFFDLFISRLVDKRYDFWFRFSLFMCIVTWGLGTLTHFFAGVGVIPVFAVLSIGHFVSSKENKWKLLKRLILSAIVFGIAFACVIGFRYYSYTTYNKQVAKGGFIGYAAPSAATYDETAKNMLTPKMMLSLETPSHNADDFINFARATIADQTFPLYVWILIVPALLLSFFKSKKIFVLSIFAAYGFIINTSVGTKIFLSTLPLLSTFVTFTSGRVYFISMSMLIPVLAAFGTYIVWGLLSDIIMGLAGRVKVLPNILKPLLSLIVVAMSLITVIFLVQRYYNLPYKRHIANVSAFNDKFDLRDIWTRIPDENYAPEDETKFDENEVNKLANFEYTNNICLENSQKGDSDICDYYLERDGSKTLSSIMPIFPPEKIIRKSQTTCFSNSGEDFEGKLIYCKAFYKPLKEQLQWKNWEPVSISSRTDGETKGLSERFSSLPNDKFRFDMSGFTGRYIMATPLVTDNSQIQIYINTLSLIYNNWNYQSQAMYTSYPLYQKEDVLSEIANWYGIDYVYLTGNPQEPISLYENDPNFSKIDDNWWKFGKDPGLVEWSGKPKVLVISDNNKYFYDQSFRFFTWGGLDFDKAYVVQGGNQIDRYSLNELKKFDVIFMRAYDYRNTNAAYSLLDDYIKQGGKLIFDTGWQYFVPDWQLTKAPSFMPFDSLAWETLGDGRFDVNDSNLDIDKEDLGSIQIAGTDWGASVPGNLREWAKPVVSYDGNVLAAVGNYGEGKVAWTGFNLIPHAEGKDNLAEIKLFSYLMDFLLDGTKSNILDSNVDFTDPDKIVTTFNEDSLNSNIYIREAYYPDWKASIISNGKAMKIKIYRAGPGFMLIDLPEVKRGDKLVIEIEKPKMQNFLEILSAVTMFLLLLYLLFPGIYAKIFKSVFGEVRTDGKPKLPSINVKKHLTSLGKSEDVNY